MRLLRAVAVVAGLTAVLLGGAVAWFFFADPWWARLGYALVGLGVGAPLIRIAEMNRRREALRGRGGRP